jgi:tRNA U34 5-carboxymethylaminomethyl modifying enzyme MnmG/GidA
MLQQPANEMLQPADIIELSDEELATVTGRGHNRNGKDKTIKTKDLANDLLNAGFNARPAKTGSHVVWTHETLPGQNIILQKKDRMTLEVAVKVRKTIQAVQEKTAGQSSSQVLSNAIDIDTI